MKITVYCASLQLDNPITLDGVLKINSVDFTNTILILVQADLRIGFVDSTDLAK